MPIDLSLALPRTTARTNALKIRDIQGPASRIDSKPGRVPTSRHATKQLAVWRREFDEGNGVVRTVRGVQPVPIGANGQCIWCTAEWQFLGGPCRNGLDNFARARIDD